MYDIDEYNKVLRVFNRQIVNENEFIKNEKNCPSYWKKQLYIEARDMTIQDWKVIRKDNYWDILNSKKEIEKYKFTLQEIKKYKNNNNKVI